MREKRIDLVERIVMMMIDGVAILLVALAVTTGYVYMQELVMKVSVKWNYYFLHYGLPLSALLYFPLCFYNTNGFSLGGYLMNFRLASTDVKSDRLKVWQCVVRTLFFPIDYIALLLVNLFLKGVWIGERISKCRYVQYVSVKSEKQKENRLEIDIMTGSYVTLTHRLASEGSRVFAVLLDWFFRGIVVWLALSILGAFYSSDEWIEMLFQVLIYMYFACSSMVSEYVFRGQTLGKRLMGIRVLSDKCEPPSFLQCFLRWLCFSVDILVVGIVMLSKTSRRLGDIASGCYVVRTADRQALNLDTDMEFKYAGVGYTPEIEGVKDLTDKEVGIVYNTLYNPMYSGFKSGLAKKLRARFSDANLKGFEANDDTEFLHRVWQDYKYYTTR